MLTKKQRECLDHIKSYHKENRGVSPSYDELCDMMGIKAKSGVYKIVCALEARGFIKRIPGASRAITVLRDYGDE